VSTASSMEQRTGDGNPAGRTGAFQCVCGRPVFFRNSVCLACKTHLGFDPSLGRIVPLSPTGEADRWLRADDPPEGQSGYRRCSNLETAAGCNWLINAAGDSELALCLSCALNRTIPDLSVAGNDQKWHQFEVAKRRLIWSLLRLRLPIISRRDDPVHGLAFDLLAATADSPHVLTGHANGVITLNIEEADDATREKIREQLHEPYRTLLGHFRHEIGHFYWDQLIKDSDRLQEFRKLFGDEQRDYPAALQAHYSQGPAADWQSHYVSAYAAAHPWEDWAETWAHYLHMTDTVETARGFGIDNVQIEFEPFTPESVFGHEAGDATSFLTLLNHWAELTAVLNELSRSMGLPDSYPFILSRDAVAKLHFVHEIIARVASDLDSGSL
jgi:hypothetical protein